MAPCQALAPPPRRRRRGRPRFRAQRRHRRPLLTIIPGWSTALHHWGSAFTLTATAGNLAAVAALTVLLVRNRRTPSHWSTYAFHLVLFVWIAWCAVPWFTEGI